jgi:hypothetical protein
MSVTAVLPKSSPAVTPASTVSPVPSVAELEDVLFDILATGGLDPNIAPSTQQAAQTFVHEHARQQKSHAEFVQFFEQHRLSMRPDRPNLMVLPPLEVRGRASETPAINPQPLDPPFLAAAPTLGMRPRVLVASGLALAAISGAVGFGLCALLQSGAQLERVEASNADSAAIVRELRDETRQLRAELANTARMVSQVDHNSERVLKTFASPLDRNAP